MNSIRSMTAPLAVLVALTTSTNIYAQSTPGSSTLATEGGISEVATQNQQEEVMRLMAAYLGLWSAEDAGRYAFERFVTEDAVFEYPYAGEAIRRIEGRSAIGQALRKFPAIASNWTFTDLKLFQTLYPHVFFVEYTAKAYVPATKRTYESRHLARVNVEDGMMANYYELWEHDAQTAAFGTAGQNGPSSIAPCTMLVQN